MDFSTKTVVITGGAKGIGAATALAFAEAGANVVTLDLSFDETIKHDSILQMVCDVTKTDVVKNVMQQVFDRFGSIDYLINNAGVQRYGTVTETSEEDWDFVLNTNLKSHFLCAKHAIPFMQRNQKGVVINVASVQAFVSQDQVAAYTTSKSALLGLTRSIAIDYAPQIRCVAVCPGTIDTPMLQNAIMLSPDPQAVLRECEDMHLAKRIGQAQEIASLIKFLCSDEASFITGEAIRIDGGLGIHVGGSKK